MNKIAEPTFKQSTRWYWPKKKKSPSPLPPTPCVWAQWGMIPKVCPNFYSAPQKTYLWTSYMMILLKKYYPVLPCLSPPPRLCTPQKICPDLNSASQKTYLWTSHIILIKKDYNPFLNPFLSPTPPLCTLPRGCDPKNSTRFELSTRKNLLLNISHDDIGQKKYNPLLTPSCVHHRGSEIQKICSDLNSTSQKAWLWTYHKMILVKKEKKISFPHTTPPPPFMPPREVWSKNLQQIWIQHPKILTLDMSNDDISDIPHNIGKKRLQSPTIYL